MKNLAHVLCAGLCCIVFAAKAQDVKKLTVITGKPGPVIQPTMWGIFFEDINFAADGGLYAELVKNRSFEFAKPLMGWKEVKEGGGSGNTLIINRGAANANNPRFARISVNTDQGSYGLANEGFRGMGVIKGEQYNFSILARAVSGGASIKIALISARNEKIGEATLGGFTNQWKKYQVSFTCSATDAHAHLNVYFTGKGVTDADMISLFPQHTFKGRANGLRADLAQMLADLHPGFLRFPGGCIVEGRDLANRY